MSIPFETVRDIALAILPPIIGIVGRMLYKKQQGLIKEFHEVHLIINSRVSELVAALNARAAAETALAVAQAHAAGLAQGLAVPTLTTPEHLAAIVVEKLKPVIEDRKP